METEHVTLDSFPEYLTASDFARYLCVTVQTLRNMEKSKRVPLADIGGGRGRGYRKRWRKARFSVGG